MKNYAELLAGALIILLTGCTSAPMALKQDTKAKLFSLPSKRALIFIYRNGDESLSELVLPTLVTVSLNGTTLGKTSAKTFFRLNVKPGNYTIGSIAEKAATLNLTVEAGKIYYVQQEITTWPPRIFLRQVSEIKGHAAVLESRVISSNVSDYELPDPDTPASTPSDAQMPVVNSVPNKLREL